MDRTVADAELVLERLFRLTATRAFEAHQRHELGLDVSRAGYAVLRSVDELERPTLGHVARECAMDPATVTRQVAALEAAGFVARSADPLDARVTVLALTDEGRDAYHEIVEVRRAYLGRVLADWAPNERRDLITVIGRLVGDLRAAPLPTGDARADRARARRARRVA